jgi:hypothetical protein
MTPIPLLWVMFTCDETNRAAKSRVRALMLKAMTREDFKKWQRQHAGETFVEPQCARCGETHEVDAADYFLESES